MSTRARRFAANARTLLLLAGLTGVLIAVGALIGGAFVVIFAAIAVAINVAGYWFSDRLALTASGARPVAEGTDPELEAMVQDLARRAAVPPPRLYMIPSEPPNAFATGRNARHAALAVTDGLRRELPPEQLRAVLAHEFGHIVNRDILLASIAAMIAGAVAAIANVFQFSLLLGDDEEDSGGAGWLGLIGAAVIAPIAASLLQLGVSRQREYLADEAGARLLGRAAPLADALEALDRRAEEAPLATNPATASLYIVNPLRRAGLATLFSTHPPTSERIRRLRTMDLE